MGYKWKVVPFCKEQLLDIDPKDIIPGGVFRTCDVYKSGGGYDKFPEICKKRLGIDTNPKQFVVQLYGCHLSCPYCYVTQNGIWGDYIEYTSEELVDEFIKTGLDVFHLMGGSPALYIDHWPELLDALDDKGRFIFHSDLLLTEKRYNISILKHIARPNCLYAVNIKGVYPEDYRTNTGKEFNSSIFWGNLWNLDLTKVPLYITFTNPDMGYYELFLDRIKDHFCEKLLEDSFIIDLIEYDATKQQEMEKVGK